jgi:hypothetical protein
MKQIQRITLLSTAVTLLVAFSALVPALAYSVNTQGTRVTNDINIYNGGGYGGGYGGGGYYVGGQPNLLIGPGIVPVGPGLYYDNRVQAPHRDPRDFFSAM